MKRFESEDKQKEILTVTDDQRSASDSWWTRINQAVVTFLYNNNSVQSINELLEAIRVQLHAQSVHVCEMDLNGLCLDCTYASLVNQVNHPMKPVCRCVYPLLMRRLRGGRSLWIQIENPDEELDQSLYTHLKEHGIQEMLAVPLMYKEGVAGFIGVDYVSAIDHSDTTAVSAVETLGRLLSLCLELRRKEMEADSRRNDMEHLFAYMPLGYLRVKLLRNVKGEVYDFFVADANQKMAELSDTPLSSFLHQRSSTLPHVFSTGVQTFVDVLDDGCYRTENYTFQKSGKKCHIVFYSSHADEVVGLFLDMTEVSRMRTALNRSEVMFKNIFEKMTAGVEIYDAEGKLVDLNPKDMELFGVKRKEDVLGINLFSNPNISLQTRQQIKDNSSVDFYTNYSFNELNGYYESSAQKNINLYTRASKIYDANQRFVGYVVISMDNTEQMDAMKRIEDFEHFFLFISDYAKVGYAKYNLLEGKGYAISQWYKNMGESPDRPIGKVVGVYEQMHPMDREKILTFFKQVRAGQVTSFNQEVRIRRQPTSHTEDTLNAVWNWVHVHVVVSHYAPEEGHIELICVNYDITNLKETEQQLIQAKEKAEEADRLKTAFLANMSHEIRTPLNAIVGFSSLLNEAQDDKERKQYIDIIQENNGLLLQLISDILDISKIEAGTLDFNLSQVDVAKLCHDLVDTMKSRTQPGVDLIFDNEGCDYELFSDPYRLRQVLINFITNAIKFTSNGSIHVGCQPVENTHLRFYVSDTGIGISPEDQERVFDRFVKLNTFIQGTGLGLPICKTIIHQLGGEIGVQSHLNQGSTFWFVLPIDIPQPMNPNAVWRK